MKAHKEITIAIVIGLIFGLIVIGGIIRAKDALDKARTRLNPDNSTPTSPQSTNSPYKNLELEITTADNQVVENPVLTITGKTIPQGYIVILGEKNEYIITPSESGTFSQEVSLVKGANTIYITVYTDNGTKVEKKITAVYSTGV